jgi:hypothetical protein
MQYVCSAGAPTDHQRDLKILETWARRGQEILKCLHGGSRRASGIKIGNSTEADCGGIKWLGTVEERARAGRDGIKRDRSLWSGTDWKYPDDFLLRHIAGVLQLPVRKSANTNGPCGPLFNVMKVIYDLLHRHEKAGRLPWKLEKEFIGTVDAHAIQHRIRQAQRQIKATP